MYTYADRIRVTTAKPLAVQRAAPTSRLRHHAAGTRALREGWGVFNRGTHSF
jgi:hypothetical protein